MSEDVPRKDYHNRNLDMIAQLKAQKLRDIEEKELIQKRKLDIQNKLKARYYRDDSELSKQVSLPSIQTPETGSRTKEQKDSIREPKEQKSLLEKQRQYLEVIKDKQKLEKQKREDEELKEQKVKNSVRQKVIAQLQDVAQFQTKDDLVEDQKLRKYPFITDYKQWKKKQRLDESVKVFIMIGGYGDIQKALLSRGWIRNPDNASPCFDYKFTLHNSDCDYNALEDFQMVNHFGKVVCLTTKVGLCKSLNNLIWFNTVDKGIFYPRAFDLSDEEDFDNFRQDFQLSKAESILKMYLHLFKQKNKAPLNKIVPQVMIALEVLSRQLININILIDMKKVPPPVSPKEWDVLSKNDLSIEALAKKKHDLWIQKISDNKKVKKKKKNAQQTEESTLEEVDELTQKVMDLLQILKEKSPQYYLNGCENIWIIKPAGSSRGRGIQCYKNLVEIEDHVTKGQQWIVQKYIEKPLIVLGKKMDIRQWVLVTDWNPLTVYVYEECYVRFTAEEYDPKDLENKLSHLTNNSIQKKGEHFHKSDIEGNMWSQDEFSAYLHETHNVNFDQIIRPQFEQIAVYALQSCQDQVDQRKNSHEIFGYDFMIDDKFHVWLIEVNSSPDMSYSTHVTERLVKEASEELIKTVVDRVPSKFKRVHKAKAVIEKPPSVGLNLCIEGKTMKKVKG